MRILGIDTPAALLRRWTGWLAPQRQPFLSTDDDGSPRLSDAGIDQHTHDMYEIWNVNQDLRVRWLDEETFHALPRAERTALVRAQREHGRGEVPSVRDWQDLVPDAKDQAGGHRFVWWPSLLAGRERDVLARWVADDMLPSRHAEVPADVWRDAKRLLPNARQLAGTWAPRTGPNCFGTVMAAAGVVGAEDVWMLREPFEEFLDTRTRPGKDDQRPGTVMAWRSHDGLVQHAAVTLGGGYVFQKQSQGWYSPREVLTVRETVQIMRTRGWRLSRRRLR